MSEPFEDDVTRTTSTRPNASPLNEATSVLELGMSPWMRVRPSPPGTVTPLPPAAVAARASAARASADTRAAIILKGVKSIEQKELESGARRERRVEKAQKEMDIGVWEEENLRRCRWYFCVGCFGLPLLHFVSVVYFMRELKGHDRDFKINRYIYLSLIVGIIESFILILWVVVFQLLRDTSLSSVSILNSKLVIGTLV